MRLNLSDSGTGLTLGETSREALATSTHLVPLPQTRTRAGTMGLRTRKGSLFLLGGAAGSSGQTFHR